MASIETIAKRIEGKRKEIAKLEKKLERINKAKASNWENNPYFYSENDLKWTTRDLEEAKIALAKYEAELIVEEEKNASRNVTAIIEFLDRWAERVKAYYGNAFHEFLKAREEFWAKDRQYCEWRNHGGWKDPNKEQIEAEYRAVRKAFTQKWNWITPYIIGRDTFDTEKLHKELEQEKKAKYDDIINRTNAITGTITDASGLRVGEKGELNGYITGERGKAKVETIGAGGYNIQCFHFRTLVKKAK